MSNINSNNYDEKNNISESNIDKNHTYINGLNISKIRTQPINNTPNTRHIVSQQNGVAPKHSLQAVSLRAALKRTAAKPNGLLIGDQLIQRITGPVSITVLKPPAKSSFYMPSLLLFGDAHFSTHGECEACEPSDGCYRISEDAFYQVFDHVSTIDAPIDFYIEAYMKEMPNGARHGKNGELFRTIEHFRRCAAWDKSKEQRYRRPSCPTQRVRYHYSDARQADYSEDTGSMFETLLSYMHMYPEQTKKNILNIYEPVLKQIGVPIVDAFDEIGDMYDMEKMPNKGRYIDEMCKLIMNAPSKYSRIRKQLEKMPKGFQFEWIKEMISNALHVNPKRTVLFSWMVDVYTLLRLFKVPTEGPPPALAGLYFGYSHTRAMTFFLINVLHYDVIYHDEVTSTNNNTHTFARCIVINKHVDIDHLLITSQRQLIKQHVLMKQNRNASRKNEKKVGSTPPSTFKKGGRTTKNKRRGDM